MAQVKIKGIKELNAYFLPEGFAIDEVPEQSADTIKKWKSAFDDNKFKALFHLGFLNKELWYSSSIEFLHHIAEILIKKLSQQSEIEFYRDKV
jgi:non-specific serine/threonine protein kinase